jgi:hypothetical protein
VRGILNDRVFNYVKRKSSQAAAAFASADEFDDVLVTDDSQEISFDNLSSLKPTKAATDSRRMLDIYLEEKRLHEYLKEVFDE